MNCKSGRRYCPKVVETCVLFCQDEKDCAFRTYCWDDCGDEQLLKYCCNHKSGGNCVNNHEKHAQTRKKFRNKNGDVYEVRFLNGLYHGLGEMTYVNGATYEGWWVEGMWSGLSTNTNGQKSKGMWKGNVKLL